MGRLGHVIISFLVIPLWASDLTITLGGDLNFNKNRRAVIPDGYIEGNRVLPWSELTQNLAKLSTGDLNFANIETVVSSRNDLKAQDKGFVFNTHPNAIQHLIDLGFNLFSLANNHAYDHGQAGIDETLANMNKLSQEKEIFYAGLGTLSELRKPVLFKVKGYQIAFAAIGIMDTNFQATEERNGMLNYYNPNELKVLLKNFAETDADLKIISVHYGTEGRVNLDSGQKEKYEKLLTEGDIDLVIGHHPHVVRPIQLKKEKLIFYSLGNYLMLGASDISGRAQSSDYGLHAKVHFNFYKTTSRLKAVGVDLLPLTNMHRIPAKFSKVQESQKRLQALASLGDNALGAEALPIFWAEGSFWGQWRRAVTAD